MKIGIDLDDVTFEFVPELLKILKKKHDKEVLIEKVTSYSFSPIFNLNSEEINDLIKEVHFKGLPLCEGVKDFIFELAKKNKIYFITSRVIRDGTSEGLEKHFSEIDYDLIFSSNHYINSKGKNKGVLCKELGIDFMIEDSFEHAKICALEEIKTFLLDKPWNQHAEEHENIICVKNWKEILEKIKEVEDEN